MIKPTTPPPKESNEDSSKTCNDERGRDTGTKESAREEVGYGRNEVLVIQLKPFLIQLQTLEDLKYEQLNRYMQQTVKLHTLLIVFACASISQLRG